ncbi:MAG: bifunctional methylenetetrahydrofolate dehydrogenase/methenyltetrahydrofolate cyclohydrolase FolD [Deltaproteobacteria bacterium]|nr:bifunctional methylenetetrahydrofolate dehydrogenase/methenyltetrahydrofolate cyclohydrolase FolD [Deltaproteobacteria bacterium]
MATLLDGKALAAKIRADLKARVLLTMKRLRRPPGLGVVLVGDDPGSAVYVRNKEKAALEVGLRSAVVRLPADAREAEVLAAVDQLNAEPGIDGFLVQLPLPAGIREATVVARVLPEKDADGLHPENLGALLKGVAAPRPCTPAGVMALLDSAKIELAGKRAVVVGRSAIVGKPMAMMLLERHATVTLCHSRTKDLAGEIGRAEVVVVAIGKPGAVKGDWIAEGAVVVDVGINRVDGKLTGDVEFAAASARASYITPVPGGVGPLTVAMLVQNTVELWERKP